MILGASGMLGKALRGSAPAGSHAVVPSSRELDITDAGALARALDACRPDVVVNAAAYTNVDRAETERERAFRVNADGPRHLGRACAARGVRVVHYSTDYVFSGAGDRPWREEDPVAPLNAYGESKLAGERALLESGARALVLRTSWLFGPGGRSFPRTMWERARQGEPTRVVNDQQGRPTATADLAAATWGLLATDATGVVHVSNGGEPTTWYEVARAVFTLAGAPQLVAPCSSADYPTFARRPAYSVLDTTRLERLLGAPLRPWREALDGFVATLEEGAVA